MRLVSLSSLVFVLAASVASGQAVDGTGMVITGKGIIGGSVASPSLLPDTLRLIGVRDVVNGATAINPVVRDNDGDILEDTNTTVSTGGAWTWGSAGSFTSSLAITGDVTGNGGTLFLASPTRISTAQPWMMLRESDQAASAKNWAWEADGGSLYLRLYDDTPSSSNAAVRLDRSSLVPGDWRWGSLLNTIRPENNGGSNLGSLNKKYLTLHAWELWVQTLVAQNVLATIGGRIMVAPTTELTRDVASGDTVVYVKHNQSRTNDTLLLQANGLFEKMLVTSNATDCSVSGNCAVVGSDFRYSVTRNRDGTGANDWAAGSALVNEGNVGDGYIDIYSDRSATSEGYVGQVVTDGPVVYFRMPADTATTNNDHMGSGIVATEGGTPSNGLGVSATLWSSVADPAWENTGGAGFLTIANTPGLQFTADVSIEFIAAWQRTVAQTEVVFSKGAAGEYHLQAASNGALSFCHGNTSTSSCVTTAAGVMTSDGIAHHYAVVRDAVSSPKRVLFYKDGVEVHSDTYTQTVATSSGDLLIGRNPGAGENFDGYIDEFAIYNYQLPADRILLHANARLNSSISKFTIGPTLCGNVRTGTAAFDLAERWCLGNLAGTYGYNSVASVYGVVAGEYSTDWISADSTNGFRNMYGNVTKWQAQGGNMFLTGDLSIGTAGSLRSGATAYDTGTGYYLEYNGGTPRMRIGTTSAGTDYLRYTGSALELKSNQLSIGGGGISLPARDTDSYNAAYGYDFRSIWTGGLGMWGYDDSSTNRRWLRLWNIVTTAGKTGLVQLLAGDEDADLAVITVDSGTTASSDSNINFSAQTITVDVTNTGATANLSCGAGQAIKTLNVRKGIIIATPTCGAP